jgi:alpha-tubulin suppressor-like RCC1 family protein
MQLASRINRSSKLVVFTLVALALMAVVAQRSSADYSNPKLSAGAASTCAVYPNGLVYCWGSNKSKQLGIGSARFTYAPRPTPVKSLGGTPVGVSVGVDSACSILTIGAIQCWGHNGSGALGAAHAGHNADDAQTASALIGAWASPSNQSTGGDHSCYRDNNKTVKCLGGNAYGQLGNGSATNSSTPVQTAIITGANNATSAAQVVTGSHHSCARLENRNVKCWGVNNYRQLGTPALTVPNLATPVDVPDLANDVIQLASRADHTCAIRSNNDAYCWGADSFGQLGDGTIAPYKGVVKVALTTDVREISTGTAHTCALVKGGGVRCWGSNNFGQLGNGTTTSSSKPVSVVGLPRPATEVTAGGEHSCAKLDTGEIRCWGRNSSGQLGNKTRTGSSIPTIVITPAGPSFANVKLTRTSGHGNFSATFAVRPPISDHLRSRCKGSTVSKVAVVQGGITRTKSIHAKLRVSRTTCVARLKYRSITSDVGAANITISSSFRGSTKLPAAKLTQTFTGK